LNLNNISFLGFHLTKIDPMELEKAFAFKRYMEEMLLRKLYEATQEVNDIPVSMKKVIIEKTIDEFSAEMKQNYPILKEVFAKNDISISFSIPEFNLIIDEAAEYVRFQILELSS